MTYDGAMPPLGAPRSSTARSHISRVERAGAAAPAETSRRYRPAVVIVNGLGTSLHLPASIFR